MCRMARLLVILQHATEQTADSGAVRSDPGAGGVAAASCAGLPLAALSTLRKRGRHTPIPCEITHRLPKAKENLLTYRTTLEIPQ